jgi:hypothetical protein
MHPLVGADEELMRWGLVAAGTIWGVLIFVFRDKLSAYLDRRSPEWPAWLRRSFPLIMTGVMAVWVLSLAITGWGVY